MNKKVLLGMACISILGLSGCHSNNKKDNHTQTKIEKSDHQKSTSQEKNLSSISSAKELESHEDVTQQSDNNQPSNNADQQQNNTQSNIQYSNSNVNQQKKDHQNNNGINITSGNAAGIYLKQQLGYGNNSNIVAGNDPSYDGNDQSGHFYTVSLMDMSDRVQGKTGSMGIYRVYSNGKIIQVAQ